jgi:hypothetical protein
MNSLIVLAISFPLQMFLTFLYVKRPTLWAFFISALVSTCIANIVIYTYIIETLK